MFRQFSSLSVTNLEQRPQIIHNRHIARTGRNFIALSNWVFRGCLLLPKAYPILTDTTLIHSNL